MTQINGEQSGGVSSDPLICGSLAEVVLILSPAAPVTDSGAVMVNVKGVIAKGTAQGHR